MNTKKLILSIFSLVLISSILFSSCKKNNEEIGFEFQYQRDFVINAGIPPLVTRVITFQDFQGDLETRLAQQGWTLDNVKYVKPSALEVEVITSAVEDLSVLNKVDLLIQSDSLPQKTIGYYDNVRNDSRYDLFLVPENKDIIDYTLRPNFDLILKVTPRAITSSTMECRLTVKFAVIEN